MAIRIDTGSGVAKIVLPSKKKKKSAPAASAPSSSAPAPAGYLPNGRPAPNVAPTPPPPPPPKTPGKVTDLDPLQHLGKELDLPELRWLTKLSWTTIKEDNPPELNQAISAARDFIDKVKADDPTFSVGLDYNAFHDFGKTQNTKDYQEALDAKSLDEMELAGKLPKTRSGGGLQNPSTGPGPKYLADLGPFTHEDIAAAARRVYANAQDAKLAKLLVAKNILGTRTVPSPSGEGKAIEVLLGNGKNQFTITIPTESLPSKVALPASGAAAFGPGEAEQGLEGVYRPEALGGKMDLNMDWGQQAWHEVFADTSVPNLPLEIQALLAGAEAPELDSKKAYYNMFLALKNPLVKSDPENPYRLDPETFFGFEADLQNALDPTSDTAIAIANRDPDALAGVLTPNEGDRVFDLTVPTGQLSDEDKLRLGSLLTQVPLSVGISGLGQDIDDFVGRQNMKDEDMRRRFGADRMDGGHPFNAVTMIQEWLTTVDPSITPGDRWTPQMDEAIKTKCYSSALWRAYADPQDDEARLYLQVNYGIDDAGEFLTKNLAAPPVYTQEQRLKMTDAEREAYLAETIKSDEDRMAELVTGLAAESRLPFESPESAVYKLWTTKSELVTPEYSGLFEHTRSAVAEDLQIAFTGGSDPLEQQRARGGKGVTGRRGVDSTIIDRESLDTIVHAGLSMAALELGRSAKYAETRSHTGSMGGKGLKPEEEPNTGMGIGEAVSNAFNAAAQGTTTLMESDELATGEKLAAGAAPGSTGRQGKGKVPNASPQRAEFNTEAAREWSLYIQQQSILNPELTADQLSSHWRQLGYSWDEMKRRAGGHFMSMGVYVLQDLDPEYRVGDNQLAEFFIDSAFELVAYAPLGMASEVLKPALTGSRAWIASRNLIREGLGFESTADVMARCTDAATFVTQMGIQDPQLAVKLADELDPVEIARIWGNHSVEHKLEGELVEDTGVRFDPFTDQGHLDMLQVDPFNWGFGTSMKMEFGPNHPMIGRLFHVMNKTTQGGEHTLDINSVQSFQDAASAVIKDPVMARKFGNATVRVLSGDSTGSELIDELERLLLPQRAAAREAGSSLSTQVVIAQQRLKNLEAKVAKLREVVANPLTKPKARAGALRSIESTTGEVTALQTRLSSQVEREAVGRGRRATPAPRTGGELTQGERLLGQRIFTEGERLDIKHNLKATIDDMYDLLDTYRYSKPANDPRVEGLMKSTRLAEYDAEIARTAEEFPDVNGGQGFISDGAAFEFWTDNVVRGADSRYRRRWTTSLRAKADREEGIGQKYGTEPWKGGKSEASTAVGPGEVYNEFLAPGVAARGEVRQVQILLDEVEEKGETAAKIIDKMNGKIQDHTRATRARTRRQVIAFQKAGLDADAAVTEADRTFIRQLGDALGFSPADLQDKGLDDFMSLAHESGIPLEDVQRWGKEWGELTKNMDVSPGILTSDPEGIAAAVARRAVRRQSAMATKQRAETMMRMASADRGDFELMGAMLHTAQTGDPSELVDIIGRRSAFESVGAGEAAGAVAKAPTLDDAYRLLAQRGILTERELSAMGIELGEPLVGVSLVQGRGSEFDGFFRALAGDDDELVAQLEAHGALKFTRDVEGDGVTIARDVIAQADEAMAKFELAAGQFEQQLQITREFAAQENRGSIREAYQKAGSETDFPTTVKDPETGLRRPITDDEMRARLRPSVESPQPMLPSQLAQYAHPPWDTHEMQTWSLGPTARRIEEFNAKKRWLFAGHSVDEASNLFKTIILARLATAFRITLGDEATRFLPEGINPMTAQHQFKELLEYEMKTGKNLIPPDLRADLSRIYGTVRKSNYTVMGPEDPDFLVSWSGALRQWNADPLVREWRAEYTKNIAAGMTEEEAGQRCKEMLLNMAGATEDNVVNQHLRLTNQFWPAEAPLKTSFGNGTAADVLEQMKIAWQTQNLDEWAELTNHNLLFYARNKYTKQHFLPRPDGSYLQPQREHFRWSPVKKSVSRADDVKHAPHSVEAVRGGVPVDETDVMPTIIARVQGAEPGNPWTPQAWFGAALEGISGHMIEGCYGHFYTQMRTKLFAELGQRAGLKVVRGTKGFNPENVWEIAKFLPKDAVEEVERRAMAYGQQQVRRVMYTSGTSATEDLMRNMVLFLPAQRQYLAYWGKALMDNPVLLAYFNRLNQLPDYLELPGVLSPGDLKGENTKYRFYMRGLLFATPGFRADSMGQKLYSMVPGLGLPGLLVGMGANVADMAGWQTPKNVAMHLPGGTFYKDMYRPLNTALTQFTYAISTMLVQRPFQFGPEQLVGDNSDRLYKYSNFLKATMARSMKDRNFGTLPEAKSHARWTEGLRSLVEAGWNFMVPSKLTISDTDSATFMDQQRAWDNATTYGERVDLLKTNATTNWGKFMTYSLQEDQSKAKDFLWKHPEILPYAVTTFGVIKPQGEDYDFEGLIAQTKTMSKSSVQLKVTLGITKQIDAEQKWFDEVYLPAVQRQDTWVGPGMTGLPNNGTYQWTPSSQYNIDRLRGDFTASTGVFAPDAPGGGITDPATGFLHQGLGKLQNDLDRLGGKQYLPKSDFPSTSDSMLYQATDALFQLRSGARFVRTSKNYQQFSDIYRVSHKEGEREVIISAATKPFTRMTETEIAAVYGKRFGTEEKTIQQYIGSQITWYDKMKGKWEAAHPGEDYRDSDIGKQIWSNLTNEIWKYCAGPKAPESLRGGVAKQLLYTPLVRPHYVIYENADPRAESQQDPSLPQSPQEMSLDATTGINDIRPVDPTRPNQPRLPSSLPVSDPSGTRKVKFGERALPERVIAGIIANAAFHFRWDDKKHAFMFSKADMAVSHAEDAYLKAYMKTADPITRYNVRETQRAYCWHIILTEMVEEHAQIWGYQSEYQKDNAGYKGRTPTETTTTKVLKKVKKQWLEPLFDMSPLFKQEWLEYNKEAYGENSKPEHLLWYMLNTWR